MTGKDLQRLNLLNFFVLAAVAATANAGNEIDSRQLDGDLMLVLDAENTAGVTPTLDCKLQHTDTSGSGYVDAGAVFVQTTTVAGKQVVHVRVSDLKRFLKLYFTIGGTSAPAYNVSVTGFALPQNG